MPYKIETRKVSLAKWWNPWSWDKFTMEWRYVWDINITLSPNEFKDFTSDPLGFEWRQTTPPVLLIVRNGNPSDDSYHYVKEEDLCPK